VLHFYPEKAEKRNSMFSIRTYILTLSVILLSACTQDPSGNIDAEPALAVLGGAVLGTQNNAVVASRTPKALPKNVFDFLNLIPDAYAATACPSITTGSCSGPVLTVFYNNCQPSGVGRSGYWRSNISYTFPTALDCTNILGTGFNAAGVAGLVGKTVIRQWGGGSQGADQINARSARDSVVGYMYSDFPSGWQDDRQGGVEITFDSATVRRMVVKGVHAVGIKHETDPVTDPSSFDLSVLPTSKSEDETVDRIWDHTINSTKQGDSLFSIGPSISLNGSTVSFGGTSNNTRASYDGDIVVTSDTVAAGAQLRVQHNISSSIGVVTVTTPLVYSDPSCCYPMSGEVRAVYDLGLRVPTVEERMVFTGSSCGQVRYTTSVYSNELITLSHCF
jgi:hypothetical protein